jgi:ribulose bisphosphate carboxylase small subunit
MNDNLQMVTGLTNGERKKVLTWVSSLTEERVIEIVQSGVKKGYQIKDEHPELPRQDNKILCSDHGRA